HTVAVETKLGPRSPWGHDIYARALHPIFRFRIGIPTLLDGAWTKFKESSQEDMRGLRGVDYTRLDELVQAATHRFPSAEEVKEFDTRFKTLGAELERQSQTARRQAQVGS